MNVTTDDPKALIAVEREGIDNIDAEIAELLCRRYWHVQKVGVIKAQHSLAVHDPHRESRQMEALSAIALRNGVPRPIVLHPFRMIINASRASQGERRDGPIESKFCMVCQWITAGIDGPDGIGVRVCPKCGMPLG